MVGDYCEFRNRSLVNYAVIMNLHAWVVSLDALHGSMSEAWRRVFFIEGAKYMMPLSRAHTALVGRKLPWVFEKLNPAMARWITATAMGTSVVYKKKAPATKRAAPKKATKPVKKDKDT